LRNRAARGANTKNVVHDASEKSLSKPGRNARGKKGRGYKENGNLHCWKRGAYGVWGNNDELLK